MMRYRMASMAVLALLLARPGWADVVGAIAERETATRGGTGELFTELTIGDPVHRGDELRTDEKGRAFVNFQDRSAIRVSENARILIGEQRSTPSGFRSVLSLRAGTIRVMVSSGTQCEIETPTAVSRCHGTDFIVSYDSGVTTVIGINGRVEVQSIEPGLRRSQYVSAGQFSTVAVGKAATAPAPVDEVRFRQAVERLDFVGGGRPESLTVDSAAASGAEILSEDLPPRFRLPVAPLPQEQRQPAWGPGDIANPPLPVEGQLELQF